MDVLRECISECQDSCLNVRVTGDSLQKEIDLKWFNGLIKPNNIPFENITRVLIYSNARNANRMSQDMIVEHLLFR